MSNATSAAPAGAMRTLLGLKEPGKQARIVVWDTAEVSLGRAPENDVVVEDSDASRQHALFVRSAEGHQVQDLGTSNGTQVNGVPIAGQHLLQNKDAVKIGDVEITFIQTRKDPASLGLPVDFASALKGFTTPAAGVDPGATTLGLAMPASGEFEVDAVGSFDPNEPAPTRDLDLEFNDFVPGEALPSAGSDTLSFQVELEGLTPELAQALRSLFGKQIELPALKLRLKSD